MMQSIVMASAQNKGFQEALKIPADAVVTSLSWHAFSNDGNGEVDMVLTDRPLDALPTSRADVWRAAGWFSGLSHKGPGETGIRDQSRHFHEAVKLEVTKRTMLYVVGFISGSGGAFVNKGVLTAWW